MIIALGGWGDASATATSSVRWMISQWQSERIARIRPNDFFDFSVARPRVRLDANGQRRIVWPRLELYHAQPPELDRDVLLLHGREPGLHWPEFADTVLSIARHSDATLCVTLGAFLAPVLHSAPVRLTGYASDDELTKKLLAEGVSSSNYEGPTGIASVLHDVLRRAGLRTFSLWAAAPFYLGNVNPNPRISYSLIVTLNRLLDLGLDVDRLRHAADYFDEQVARQVEQNSELSQLIEKLRSETAAAGDIPEREALPQQLQAELPSSESILKDLEDFLRQRRAGDEPQAPS